MSYDFETTSYGKWILSGEHAVLRGHPAIVFPLKTHPLTLTYLRSPNALHITQAGIVYANMDDLVRQVIRRGLVLLNKEHHPLLGQLHLVNAIPLGVGLGASAALCVAIARWLNHYFDSSMDCFQFARQLEHLFHGQSSGLDIAGTAANGGIYFQNGHFTPILSDWQPHWHLSTSHEIGHTAQCIQQVNQLWQNDTVRAQKIDVQMAESVHIAHLALLKRSLTTLTAAIQLAHDCFEQWGLITTKLQTQIQQLKEAGALAVKPTGSGGGGHLLSVWAKPPADYSFKNRY